MGWGGVGDGPQHGGWAGQASPRQAPATGQASPASGQAQRPAQRRDQASLALRPAPRPRMLPRGGRQTPAAACAAAARAPARRRREERRGRGQSGTRQHGWAAVRRQCKWGGGGRRGITEGTNASRGAAASGVGGGVAVSSSEQAERPEASLPEPRCFLTAAGIPGKDIMPVFCMSVSRSCIGFLGPVGPFFFG